ncbi:MULTISPECIES: hypothetical protein [unclassified Nocardia]|uniref:hypothetical protein n=1 Tax=unclassified Nocardia TaxID=2637762 RepID=UPI001CE3EBAD|nr:MULTISPECIES: hypothetical protein [unclassified Nocardia]
MNETTEPHPQAVDHLERLARFGIGELHTFNRNRPAKAGDGRSRYSVRRNPSPRSPIAKSLGGRAQSASASIRPPGPDRSRC